MTTHDRPATRIRLREDQARLMARLLWAERSIVATERANWKNMHMTNLGGFNQILALIDATIAEVNRGADDMGWDLGEPRRPNT